MILARVGSECLFGFFWSSSALRFSAGSARVERVSYAVKSTAEICDQRTSVLLRWHRSVLQVELFGRASSTIVV